MSALMVPVMMTRQDRGRLKVDAVIPAGAESPLLEACLGCLAAQTVPLDQVIVVDDSPDGSVRRRAGVRLLHSRGRGPYAARNVGWRASDADVVLFLDVRSRPRPEWARRLTDAFEDPSVALASSDVRVTGNSSLGARVGRRHRFFRRERYTRDGLFRPYAPTCNLGVRREALVEAGGFREVRSSADMDLCWRILADPAKRLESATEALMEWVPRDRLRDYFEQCYRYGNAHQPLYAEWVEAGAPEKQPFGYLALSRTGVRLAGRMARAGLVRRDGSEVIDCLREGGRLVYELGYRRAAGSTTRSTTRAAASPSS